MLDILVNGWNFFSKKAYLLYAFLITLIYVGFTVVFSGYITNTITTMSEQIINIKAIHFFGYFYKEMIIIALFWLAGLIIINYLCYVIGRSNSDKKIKNTGNGLGKTIVYSLIFFFVILATIVIGLIFLSFIESSLLLAILFLILLIILAIFSVVIVLLFSIGVFHMGLNGTPINQSLTDAWVFLKKRFWLLIGFIILIAIFLGIIYFLIDSLYYIIFGYNEIASMIIRYILLFIFLLYSTNSVALFIKKYTIGK